jgi:secondary thiamine-phosphate synthase enzyme
MRHHQLQFSVRTLGRGTHEITAEVAAAVAKFGSTGLCQVFVRHTSASLIICENADPEVRRDLERFLERLVPDGEPMFRHTMEGPDDMPAHVRSVLTQTALSVPVREGRLLLGTWQGIYLYEHRLHGHQRELVVTLVG